MRCLDDLPKGCFICVYTGLLLSEDGANEDGANQGDEYLAELDHIEVVEKQKEEMKPDEEGIFEDSDAEDADEQVSQCAVAALLCYALLCCYAVLCFVAHVMYVFNSLLRPLRWTFFQVPFF